MVQNAKLQKDLITCGTDIFNIGILSRLYESTRNRSQDPVDAGQAYRTIENGIAEARAMANQAVGDADSAKAEVTSWAFKNSVLECKT